MVSNLIRACGTLYENYPCNNKSNPVYYIRRGNVGHIFRIMNKIIIASAQDSTIKQLLESGFWLIPRLLTLKVPEWPTFCRDVLEPANRTSNREWEQSDSVASLVAQKQQQLMPADFGQLNLEDTVPSHAVDVSGELLISPSPNPVLQPKMNIVTNTPKQHDMAQKADIQRGTPQNQDTSLKLEEFLLPLRMDRSGLSTPKDRMMNLSQVRERAEKPIPVYADPNNNTTPKSWIHPSRLCLSLS